MIFLPIDFYVCQENQPKMKIKVSSRDFHFHSFRITFKELIPIPSVIALRLIIHVKFFLKKLIFKQK